MTDSIEDLRSDLQIFAATVISVLVTHLDNLTQHDAQMLLEAEGLLYVD